MRKKRLKITITSVGIKFTTFVYICEMVVVVMAVGHVIPLELIHSLIFNRYIHRERERESNNCTCIVFRARSFWIHSMEYTKCNMCACVQAESKNEKQKLSHTKVTHDEKLNSSKDNNRLTREKEGDMDAEKETENIVRVREGKGERSKLIVVQLKIKTYC